MVEQMMMAALTAAYGRARLIVRRLIAPLSLLPTLVKRRFVVRSGGPHACMPPREGSEIDGGDGSHPKLPSGYQGHPPGCDPCDPLSSFVCLLAPVGAYPRSSATPIGCVVRAAGRLAEARQAHGPFDRVLSPHKAPVHRDLRGRALERGGNEHPLSLRGPVGHPGVTAMR